MGNKIRSIVYETKGSDVPVRRQIGDSFSVNTSYGSIKLTISRIVEDIDMTLGEVSYLIYAINEKGEEGLWKKRTNSTEVEYDIIDLWRD